MSVRWSTSIPRTCSGDMYSGVPIIVPAAVSRVWSAALAIPKSVIRTFPDRSRRMFSGLMSRWTTPLRWT